MALTKSQLAIVTNNEDLKTVKVLSLRSSKLSSCFKLLLAKMGVTLQILSLRNNCLTHINICLGFTCLRSLDLSSNTLSHIGTKELWSTMPQLRVLYLHDNFLENWETLESLSVIPGLIHLTLFNNALVHLPNYRNYVLSKMKCLLALDFTITTEEERFGYSIPTSPYSKVWILDNIDLDSLKYHLNRFKRKWERSSPAIRIQSLWRSYCIRKKLNAGSHLTSYDLSAIQIQKVARGWLLRNKLQRDLEQMLRETDNFHLLYSPEEYLQYKAVLKIEDFAKNRFLLRKRRTEKTTRAAIKIQKVYRKWITQIKGVPFLNSEKLYILKTQQRTLVCLLRLLSNNPEEFHPAHIIQERIVPEFFENRECDPQGFSFASLYDRMQECTSIKVLRFPAIESIKYSSTPYFQLTS